MDNDLIFESNNKSTLDKDFKPIKKVPYKVLDFNKANSEYIKDDFKDINFILKTKKGEILIDSRTNTVIGYILVKDNGVMGPLWVDKKYRRQGFGDLLFKDGVEQYGGRELGVYKDNEVATKIYKKYGFRQSEDNKDWIKIVKEDTLEESQDKSTLDKNFKHKEKVDYKKYDFNANTAKYLGTTKEDEEGLLKDRIGEILVDSSNNKCIGYVFIIKDGKNKGMIEPLYVHEEYRGMGFSEILLKDAISKYHADRLWVYDDNEVAIRLYKKYGFKETEKKGNKITMVKEDTVSLECNILITDKANKNGNIYPSEVLDKIMEASMDNSRPEIINEDIDEISTEAVAEGDYLMRCLREGKDPYETKAINEAAMEANQKIINESTGDPVPMVGMQQPIIVTKMYKNIYNQDDSKIYIANNYKFDTIFEPDGIGTALECSLANSTLTADDLKSENTKIIDITQEQYDSFVELTKEGYTFNEALEEAICRKDRS